MFVNKLLLAITSLALVTGCTKVEDENNPLQSDNNAPTSSPLSLVTYKNTQLPLVLSGSDADGDELTYTIVSAPSHGALAGEGSSYTYTPDADYVGTDQLSFIVNDGKVDSQAGLVSLVVKENADLQITATNFGTVRMGTPRDTIVTVKNLTNGDATGIAITSTHESVAKVEDNCSPKLPALGECTIRYTFTALANKLGSATSNIVISYFNGGASTSDSHTLTAFAATAHRPVATALSLDVAKNTDKPFTLPATDADAATTLTYEIVANQGPAHGTLTGTGANRVYRPAAGYVGTDSFKFRVKDQTEYSTVQTVSIDIVEASVVSIPTFVNFGLVRLANPLPTVEKLMTVSNSSNAVATQLAFSSDKPNLVSIITNTATNACGTSLAAGASCTIKLRFAPSSSTLGSVGANIKVRYFNGAEMKNSTRGAGGIASIPGALDPNFGNGGKILGVTAANDGTERTLSTIQQSDGKIIVAGSTATGLVRLLLGNGAVDPSFAKNNTSPAGIGETPSSLRGETSSLAIQPDGKILRMNRAVINDVSQGLWIGRNLSNGKVDTTFGTQGVATSPVHVAYSSSGVHFNNGRRNFWLRPSTPTRGMQISFVGQKSATDTRAVLGRLNVNGTPDTTLGAHGVKIIPGLPYSYDIEAFSLRNGRLLVKANEKSGEGSTYVVMVDEATLAQVPETEFQSFVLPPVTGRSPSALEVRESTATPYSFQFRVIRSGEVRSFNKNGGPVLSFGTNGVKTIGKFSHMNSVRAYPNGDFVLIGSEKVRDDKYRQKLIRYKADGTLDTSFGPITTEFAIGDEDSRPKTAIIQSDGKLLLVGVEVKSQKGILSRYLP